MEKTRVSVGDKVIKLREARQLLAHFLVILQSHPELVPCLPATIGDYEMGVTPRAMMASDGSLLIPTDQASIIHATKDAKWAKGKEMEFAIHDEMAIAKVTLKEPLSASSTKATLSNTLGDALLDCYKGSQKKVVLKGTTVHVNQPYSLTDNDLPQSWGGRHHDATTCDHALSDSTMREIDVWSPDTDVLVLLMDLVANGRPSSTSSLGEATTIIWSTNIPERVPLAKRSVKIWLVSISLPVQIWVENLLASQKSWMTSYLSLPN